MINYSTSSGRKSATAQITSQPGALLGIDVTPPTSGSTVLTVYDSENSDTTGKIIISEIYLDAGAIGVNHEYFVPVSVNRGIYCTLTGTGSNYYVRYLIG